MSNWDIKNQILGDRLSFKRQMLASAVLALASLLVVFVSHQILNQRLVKSIELARELHSYSQLVQRLEDNFREVEQQLYQMETSQMRDQNLSVIQALLKEEAQLIDRLSVFSPQELKELTLQQGELATLLNSEDLRRISANLLAQKRQLYLQLKQEISETLHHIQIQLRQDLDVAYAQIKKEQKKPVVIGFILFVVLTAALILVFWRLLRRLGLFLQNMTSLVRQAQKGELFHRLTVSAPDELGRVEFEFNSMLNSIEDFKRKLEASNKDLEEFAQMASHDLQAPLRYISAYTQLLSSDEGKFSEAERSKFADNIQRSTRRLTDLIRNLLEFSKIENDRAGFVTISLNHLISQVHEESKDRHAHLNLNVEQGELEIVANSALLQTLFQNLIENSVKYSDKSNVEITIIGLRGGAHFEIIYQDNGPGIPEEDRERVFDFFQRRTETESISGDGVGLAVCRKIMRLHSGVIEILPSPYGLRLRLFVAKAD